MDNIWLKRIEEREHAAEAVTTVAPRGAAMRVALMDDAMHIYSRSRWGQAQGDSKQADCGEVADLEYFKKKFSQPLDAATALCSADVRLARTMESLSSDTGSYWWELSDTDICEIDKALAAKNVNTDSVQYSGHLNVCTVDMSMPLASLNTADGAGYIAMTSIVLPPPLSPPICPSRSSPTGMPDSMVAYTVSPSLPNDLGGGITAEAMAGVSDEDSMKRNSHAIQIHLETMIKSVFEKKIKARPAWFSLPGDCGGEECRSPEDHPVG